MCLVDHHQIGSNFQLNLDDQKFNYFSVSNEIKPFIISNKIYNISRLAHNGFYQRKDFQKNSAWTQLTPLGKYV